MVLQRGLAGAILWGHTLPGAMVHTSFDGADFSTTADVNGTWRQRLPPQNATAVGRSIHISSSSGEAATLKDVVFGDVYLCGGQSNMEYALPVTTNSTLEAAWADSHPEIRIFSVGQTQSPTPLPDLHKVWHSWKVASSATVRQDFLRDKTLFYTFSSVCWLFGKRLSEALDDEERPVPFGLISNNWGGTKLEVWTPPTAFPRCGRAVESANMYNAMIHPYTVGPMALAGVTWYQGESNVQDDDSAAAAEAYGCLFPQMIMEWRAAFDVPSLFFGFVQLSTWCTAGSNVSIAEMRDAQLSAAALPRVGWATNADHGFGCIIHPPAKQHVSRRLADSALAIVYGRNVSWRSPEYLSAAATQSGGDGRGVTRIVVSLSDVSAKGLDPSVHPYNYDLNASMQGLIFPSPDISPLNCSALPPGSCAWAAVQFSRSSWVNATVGVDAAEQRIVLEATTPTEDAVATATAYGWGPIPLLNVYDKSTGLPVLPWNRSL